MHFERPFFPVDPATGIPNHRPRPGRFMLSAHILSITLISCAIAFTSAAFLVQLRHESEQQARVTLERRMKAFRQLLDDKGEIRIVGGRLMAGATTLNDNSELPDQIQEIFGASATIFLGDIGVSTNLRTEAGKRALYPKLTGPAHEAIFKYNSPYRGETEISGIPYVTAYDPIRNKNQEPVGALFIGTPRSDFFASYEKRKAEVIATAVVINIIFVLLSITLLRQRKIYMDSLYRSEELYRSLFESSAEGILLVKGTVLACNEWACSLLGAERNDILGKPAEEIIPPLHLDSAMGENSIAWSYRRRDGKTIDTEVCVKPLQIETGPAWQVMVRDITEQKQATTLLAAEKRVMEMIVQGHPLPDVLSLICTTYEEISDGSFCSIFLVDPEGKHLVNGASPSLPAEYARAIEGTWIGPGIGACGTAAFTGERVFAADIASDPNWVKYRKLPLEYGLRACWSTPILSSDKKVLGTFAIYYRAPHEPEPFEITRVDRASSLASIAIQQTRAREGLQDAFLKQQAILDNIPDLVWMKNLDGRFVIVNEAFARACDSTPSAVVGKTDFDVWPHDLAGKYRADDIRVQETEEKKCIEELLEDSAGSRRWIEAIKTPIYKDGLIIGTTGIARDIDARKRGEAALRESEERFHQFFTQNWDAVMLLSQEHMDVVDVNPAMVDLFGYDLEELQKLGPLHLFAPESVQSFVSIYQDVADKKDSIIDHAEGVNRQGGKIALSVRARLIRIRQEHVVYCSFRDITERMRLEAEQREVQSRLIHANKMASLGMLVSGIAHEINNPNQYISINASLVADIWKDAVPLLDQHHSGDGEFFLKGLPFPQVRETMPRLLMGIEEGARRINNIVRNLKDFARDNSDQKHVAFELNSVVHEAVMILTHNIHRHTDFFTLDLAEELPNVKGKPQLIEQVIINLLTNALEALPDKKKGVAVSTRFDAAGGFVILAVKDEGKGMQKGVLERITEPFYSTRLDEGGTGLGLSISANIVKDHHGALEFESSPGLGTTATIKLRAASISEQWDADSEAAAAGSGGGA